MKEIEINLPIKPLSYNQYYRNTKTGRRVKTGAGLAYDEELCVLLDNFAKNLEKFGRGYNPSREVLALNIQVANPDFFIKDGSRMRENLGDVDNFLKVLQDKLFKYVGVDDSKVRYLHIYDYPSDNWLVDITIVRVDMPIFKSVASRLSPH